MENYAIILAAGIGSRLYPITKEYPKSLIKINGREILDYQIMGYKNSGIKEENIYIITGYKNEMMVDFINNSYPKINIIYNKDYLTTNNMYSLYLGLNSLKNNFNKIKSLFINNADCIYEENLLKDFVTSKVENIVAVEIDSYNEESMKVIKQKDGSLIDISKTITKKEAYGVSIDLYKYSSKTTKKLYKIIKEYIEVKKELNKWTEVAYPELFKAEKVYPYDIKNRKWVEIDNNNDLAIADKLFSNFDINTKKVLLCDMDGTLYVGKKPIKDAINFIQTTKNLKVYFLTNNTSKIPADYIEKLQSFKIKATQSNILTPLSPLIDYLKEKKYNSVYLIANKKVENYLKNKLPKINFEYSPKKNNAAIITYDTEINFKKLQKLCHLLNNTKIEYIATHNDTFCPTEEGPIPDIGSFIKLIEVTTKKSPDIIIGKPSTEIVKSILKNYKPEEIIVAGDRLYTDKLLADNIKCDFICVLSGETTRLDVQNYPKNHPSLILKNLGEL